MAEVAREALNQSTTSQLDYVPFSWSTAPVGGGMDLSLRGKACRASQTLLLLGASAGTNRGGDARSFGTAAGLTLAPLSAISSTLRPSH